MGVFDLQGAFEFKSFWGKGRNWLFWSCKHFFKDKINQEICISPVLGFFICNFLVIIKINLLRNCFLYICLKFIPEGCHCIWEEGLSVQRALTTRVGTMPTAFQHKMSILALRAGHKLSNLLLCTFFSNHISSIALIASLYSAIFIFHTAFDGIIIGIFFQDERFLARNTIIWRIHTLFTLIRALKAFIFLFI